MPADVHTFPRDPDLPIAESCEAAALQLFSDICAFHDQAIEQFGGTPGIRSAGELRAACMRPFTFVGGEFAFATGLEQAAALLQSLTAHVFTDGNKRTAFMATLYFLERCGYWEYDAFLSPQEIQRFEALILSMASEDDEGGQPDNSTSSHPRSVFEIAAQINSILSSSRQRQARIGRLKSGYRLLGSIHPFSESDEPGS